jgi:putative endonuclease
LLALREDRMTDWHVYMVRCADGSVYTGISTDVQRRWKEHQRGGARAARYLRTRKPVDLIFSAMIGERGAALRAEHAIKQLEKQQKEALATGALALRVVLDDYKVRRAAIPS